MSVNIMCVGIFVVDFIAANLPKLSQPGELTFTPIEMHIGGHAANVSIDLRKLGLKQGEVSSMGAVGDDMLGDYVEQTLNSYGLITHLIRTEKAPTSKDLILVVKGEDRRFHYDVGANQYLNPEFVKDIIKTETPLIFYVGAPGLLGDFDEEFLSVLDMVKNLGCVTFVDPVRPYNKEWDFLLDAASSIDIFHCNDFEASEITGKKEVKDATKILTSQGIEMAVVSMGDKGLVAGYNERLYRVPPFKVDPVDPTGAGDAFCAGLIKKIYELKYQRLKDGLNLDENQLLDVLVYGEAVGAICVTDVGTTTAVSESQVKELIHSQGKSVLSKVQKMEI